MPKKPKFTSTRLKPDAVADLCERAIGRDGDLAHVTVPMRATPTASIHGHRRLVMGGPYGTVVAEVEAAGEVLVRFNARELLVAVRAYLWARRATR